MTDVEGYLALIDRYRERFGEGPPILWSDGSDKRAWHIEKMEEALRTGEPWIRTELENIPEEALI